MKARKKPCNDCPFRKNSLAGWIGDFTPEELAQVAVKELPFSCHSVNGATELENRDALQCAGRLLFSAKACKVFRDSDLNTIQRNLKSETTNLDDILSFPELLEHHSDK